MSKDIVEKPIKTVGDAFEGIFRHKRPDDCSDIWFDVQSAKSFCESLLNSVMEKWATHCNREIQASKQRVRAEVLAACAIAVEEECDKVPGCDSDWPRRIMNVVLQLQPAAKALEELLEEARREEGEKVRKEALLDVLAFNSGLGCTPQEGYKWLVEAL